MSKYLFSSMCLIAFAYKNHPRYELIFAANRDEFYDRPTRPARFWEEYPHILAGKDLKGGGTWMGINRTGYFSALTNYRDPDTLKENPPSRGKLVLDYLKEKQAPEEYLREAKEKAHRYNGFSLLAGNMNRLMYYSNQASEIKELEPGLYGLSNHLLNTNWPKVEKARSSLGEITDSENVSREALFELLKDDQQAPEDRLPHTGIPKELERAVSPIFISTQNYGTRSSTVLLIDKTGQVSFEERRYQDGSRKVSESNRYSYQLESSVTF